ncbi:MULTISPECIES: phosphate-starvation-inducible PsiE family protein [Oleiagrimonas]|uniref:Protein PsiE n=1 Tax=Oleiagrimonas citrea TaxID=1665687 RepID=A0A846ZDP4_9GAMM|nr:MULTISPECIES: phosphate-starvation-inducible PsiE family protein [Oleiagrimonas]NKZ37505.1 phosphate-starvation-inducible PsiE family protein [Oleiagrimonas citrea]RAP58002.1 phosphate-starvation-inducible E [Oleiagrimonas sp. MCCC 1A03011]
MPNGIEHTLRERGFRLIRLLEYAGLLVVLIATLTAAGQEVLLMYRQGRVTVADLLMLFIYLELLAMNGIYWRAGRLPVRMPLYIAIVAMARHLTLETPDMNAWTTLAEGGTVLLLSLAVLVVRYGHIRLPYRDEDPDNIGGKRS